MIYLIGEITLYCVLTFYLLWNIFFFFSSSCLSRSYDLFSLCQPSRSGHGTFLNSQQLIQSILIVSNKKPPISPN